MIAHTLSALLKVSLAQTICLVVNPQDTFIKDILLDYVQDSQGRISVVYAGGDTRAQSVLAGLDHLLTLGVSKQAWVLVHDAARCLITPELVDQLIDACALDKVGGLLALPVADTLKQELIGGGRVQSTLARAEKWAAQTPQMFKLEVLRTALHQGLSSSTTPITDESSAIEALALQPLLVRGHTTNFKVTYPEDFEIAEALLEIRMRK